LGGTLKKTILKPHLKQQWVIAPEANSAFVANMADVLEVYKGPRDPAPVGASTKPRNNLILETRPAVSVSLGARRAHDYDTN